MTTRKKIEFDGPVKNVMRKYFPHCKLNSSGRVFAAEIMQEIHTLLIKSFENEYGASKQMDDNVIRCIEKAVNKLFPADIRRCALAEAHRQLILFQDGQIEYDHIASIQALKSSPEYNRNLGNRKGTVFGAFSVAASKIVATIDPDLKIDNKAKQFLGYHVYKMANEISNRAAQNAAGKSLLDYNDIKDSLPDFLKSNLLSYANREASRNLFNHEQGIQTFKPRKPSISEFTPVDPDFVYGKKTGKKDSIDLKDTPTIRGYGPSMFISGIRKIIPEFTHLSPPPKPDDGTKQISEILLSIVNFLTNDIAELSQRKNIKEIDFEHVKESIDGILSQNLREHAAINGFANVKNYVKGILKYRKRPEPTQQLVTSQKSKKRKIEPHKEKHKKKLELPKVKKKEKLMPKPKIKDKTPKKVEPRYLHIPSRQHPPSKPSTDAKKVVKEKKLNFTKAIIDIFKKSPHNLSVNIGSEATERISSYLLDICKSLITECTNQNNSVSAETVRATLVNFLPREICRHAISEAERKLALRATSLQSSFTDLQEKEKGFHGDPEIKSKPNETVKQEAEDIKEELLEEESEATAESEESDETADEPVPDEE